MRRLPLLLSVSILALSACQRPAPPDPEKPPEPKALTQAITQPLDQARDAKQALDEAAHREGQAAADAIGEPAKTNTP